MISIPAGARVLLATRPVDFRKGAHGLAALAQEILAEDPFSGAVIVYRSKRSDRLKILVWDTSGLVLIWKQKQQGSFRWPPRSCPLSRCSNVAAEQCRLPVQAARGGRLTFRSSPSGAMVSSVM